MYLCVSSLVPAEQIVVVHASLGEIEWEGVVEHIKATIQHPLNVVRANKTFFEMVESRGMFPSAATRQCTSDLKRGPIQKFIRHTMSARGVSLGVNCTGLRAEESAARSRRAALTVNKTLTLKSGKRLVYDWLPIFSMSTDDVYNLIYAAGQRPHFAYGDRGEKNTRLSCVFCIMGSRNDLRHGAKVRPELLAKYEALEKRVGHTMFMRRRKGEVVKVPLRQHIGCPAEGKVASDGIGDSS